MNLVILKNCYYDFSVASCLCNSVALYSFSYEAALKFM